MRLYWARNSDLSVPLIWWSSSRLGGLREARQTDSSRETAS